MRRFATFALLLTASPQFAQDGPDGSIADVKLAKPEDGHEPADDRRPHRASKDPLRRQDARRLAFAQRQGQASARGSCSTAASCNRAAATSSPRRSSPARSSSIVEFRTSRTCRKASGQGRGNSGVYVHGRYEVQVLDSYGLKSKKDDCGAIYTDAAPLVNACKAPTNWQSYDIDFTAPLCDRPARRPARRS